MLCLLSNRTRLYNCLYNPFSFDKHCTLLYHICINIPYMCINNSIVSIYATRGAFTISRPAYNGKRCRLKGVFAENNVYARNKTLFGTMSEQAWYCHSHSTIGNEALFAWMKDYCVAVYGSHRCFYLWLFFIYKNFERRLL